MLSVADPFILSGYNYDFLICEKDSSKINLLEGIILKSFILNSISIKSKIYLLVSFPLLLVIFFMGEFVLEQYRVVKQMNSLKLLTELTVKIGGYVHETQKERGATAGFIRREEIQRRFGQPETGYKSEKRAT